MPLESTNVSRKQMRPICISNGLSPSTLQICFSLTNRKKESCDKGEGFTSKHKHPYHIHLKEFDESLDGIDRRLFHHAEDIL